MRTTTATVQHNPTQTTETNVRAWRQHELRRRIRAMLPRPGFHNRIRIADARLSELRSLLVRR